MNELPDSVRSALRRLARRLALGVFLDVWPAWAAASLLVAGLAALVCRLFYPGAAAILPWLWLAPAAVAPPALYLCARRAYRPSEVVALADSLTGGGGTLLTLFERRGDAWAAAPQLRRLSAVSMPLIRPWRRLAAIPPAAALLATALWLPQRVPPASTATLANSIASDLTRAVAELKQQDLITPADEKRLEEEIERIRQGAMGRIDASTWEAADAVRDKVAASVSAKQDAVRWAEESLARYAAAAQGGAIRPSDTGTNADAQAAELMTALDHLAQGGLLADAPAGLKELLNSRRMPADQASLRKLAASLAGYLADRKGRLGDVAHLGKEAGRFDPSEFPLNFDGGPDGDGEPGAGGINRGRGDASLTWGDETLSFDRFKAQALPPGAVRSPDDWAPVAVLPGAPQTSPQLSTPSAARSFAATAGQTAWRRTLAPRHQSAVKRYFDQ